LYITKHKKMKTHWKKQFNYEYMGSYSLPDGKDVILTISKTAKEQVIGQNGKKEECFVCYFTESDKPMILNRTNCKTIAKIVGSAFIEDWAGQRIQLGIDTVSAFGESVEALRVRKVTPKPAVPVDYSKEIAALRACTSLDELQQVYTAMPALAKTATVNVKDEMKGQLT
jgi:hypothetical protein